MMVACVHGAGDVFAEALSGTTQRPMVHFLAVSTRLPRYRTSTSIQNLMNLTSRPALHSCTQKGKGV